MTLILIAFGLAMDAFAVSVTSGLTIKDLRINHALTLAVGLSLSFLKVFIVPPAIIIGVITLIAIGIKILVSHLTAGPQAHLILFYPAG